MTHLKVPYTELADWPRVDPRSFRVICDGRSGTGTEFIPVFLFLLSVSFHQCCIIIIYTFLLPERQMDQAWEPSKKKHCSYGNRKALDFHFFFRLS